MDINALSEEQVAKDFLPFCRLSLQIVVSFTEKKLFGLIPSHLLILDFNSCALGILLKSVPARHGGAHL